MSFHQISLAPGLISALERLGIQTPTPAQHRLFPLVSQGRDVLLAASTGSGKTLAYLLPLLDQMIKGERTRCACTLIVVPTRELVAQLAQVLEGLLPQIQGARLVELAGGSSLNAQLLKLRGGADFLLATPGRLLDIIEHNGLSLCDIDVLILDEADRLLGEGFQDQLDELCARLRPRQRLMISATYTRKVRAKAKWILKNPEYLDLVRPLDQVRHRAIQVDEQCRLALLLHLFESGMATPALIFVANRRGAEQLGTHLRMASVESAVLHGKLSMAQRARVLHRLEKGQLKALVATDLAARGIDVPSLPLVINYDLPRSVELYTHRIGRTARAGQAGEALSLVDINAEAHLQLIEKRLAMQIPREFFAGFEPINTLQRAVTLSDGNGGIKGRRMSKKDKLRLLATQQHLNKPVDGQDES